MCSNFFPCKSLSILFFTATTFHILFSELLELNLLSFLFQKTYIHIHKAGERERKNLTRKHQGKLTKREKDWWHEKKKSTHKAYIHTHHHHHSHSRTNIIKTKPTRMKEQKKKRIPRKKIRFFFSNAVEFLVVGLSSSQVSRLIFFCGKK